MIENPPAIETASLRRAIDRVAMNEARIVQQEARLAQLERSHLAIQTALARELLRNMQGLQKLARQLLEQERARHARQKLSF
jgi:hypothetical protein